MFSAVFFFFFSYACHEPQLISHETVSSSAECSRDKPPFSFVREQDSNCHHSAMLNCNIIAEIMIITKATGITVLSSSKQQQSSIISHITDMQQFLNQDQITIFNSFLSRGLPYLKKFNENLLTSSFSVIPLLNFSYSDISFVPYHFYFTHMQQFHNQDMCLSFWITVLYHIIFIWLTHTKSKTREHQ